MSVILWLLALLNPYQFAVPQHTGATGGSATPTVTAICAPSGGIPGSGNASCNPAASVSVGTVVIGSIGMNGGDSWTGANWFDSGSNTYTVGPIVNSGVQNYSAGQGYSKITTGLTTASTVTFNATSYGSMGWVGISGLGSGALDVSGTATNNSAITSVSSSAVTNHNDVCVAVFAGGSNLNYSTTTGTLQYNTNSGQIVIISAPVASGITATISYTSTSGAGGAAAISCFY